MLRAIAAVSVMAFHIFGDRFLIGAVGVDVFFIISGYIMGAFGGNVSTKQFIYSRITRIVPLYWAVTIVMCLGALAGVFSSFSFTADQLWRSLLFVPYLNSAGDLAPLVVVGWTLNMEMFFYVVFAIGLAFGSPFMVTTLVLASLVFVGQLADWQAPAMQVWTSPLLLEFLAGLLLARVRLPQRTDYGLVCLVLAAAGFVLATLVGEPTGIGRVLIWGLPAALLVAGCITLESAASWPRNWLKPLELIGDASYALYLSHGLTISLVQKLLAPGLLASVVMVVSSLLVAIGVHFLFERPVIHLLKRRGVGGHQVRSRSIQRLPPIDSQA